MRTFSITGSSSSSVVRNGKNGTHKVEMTTQRICKNGKCHQVQCLNGHCKNSTGTGTGINSTFLKNENAKWEKESKQFLKDAQKMKNMSSKGMSKMLRPPVSKSIKGTKNGMNFTRKEYGARGMMHCQNGKCTGEMCENGKCKKVNFPISKMQKMMSKLR